MHTFLLWFNIVSFALLFAAAGCTFIRQIKTPMLWQGNYLFYQVSWAFWLLLCSYSFFKHFFTYDSGPQLDLIYCWIRIIFSFLIFNLLPVFVRQAAGKQWKIWQALLSSGVLSALIVIYLKISELTYIIILNSGYHLFLAVITISGFRRYRLIKKSERKLFFEFFLLHMSFYLVLLTIINVFFQFFPSGLKDTISIAFIGFFTFSWAFIDILCFINDLKLDIKEMDRVISVPERLGLTPRESEILAKILEGATNKEISDGLFISIRTVEAHLSSIYRKCGVNTKVKLIQTLKMA